MYLLYRETQEEIPAEIIPISAKQLKQVMATKQFDFNWLEEVHHHLYAIRAVETVDILGLLALKDVPSEQRIEIILVEVSKRNRGKNKILERIAGCLIAWACRQAFDKKYNGFVSLVPKTELIVHYRKKYGFLKYGFHLVIHSNNSQSLINEYL